MKKINFVKLACIACLVLGSVSFFASCKSTAAPVSVANVAAKKTPFEVLSSDSAIYLKMPVQENSELATQIIVSKVEGISEKDARRLAKQIKVLWAGLSSTEKLNRAEFYATGAYPTSFLGSTLSENNGWKERTYVSPTEVDIPYFVHSSSKMELAFPSTSLLLASTGVTKMLSNLYTQEENSAEYVDWLKNSAGEDSSLIKFYVSDASKFITSFMGGIIPNAKNFASNCKDIYGTLINKSGEDYLLSLKINLNNPKAATAYMSMLKLGFALAGITVTQPDEKTLSIQDIPVKQSQIISLL